MSSSSRKYLDWLATRHSSSPLRMSGPSRTTVSTDEREPVEDPGHPDRLRQLLAPAPRRHGGQTRRGGGHLRRGGDEALGRCRRPQRRRRGGAGHRVAIHAGPDVRGDPHRRLRDRRSRRAGRRPARAARGNRAVGTKLARARIHRQLQRGDHRCRSHVPGHGPGVRTGRAGPRRAAGPQLAAVQRGGGEGPGRIDHRIGERGRHPQGGDAAQTGTLSPGIRGPA
jgi:hypothetical protein